MEIKIENKLIGENHPCFIIAEAGVNHNGSFEMAKKLIDAAKEANADAVKFQTFKTEEVVTPKAPKANYQMETTNTKESQYEMLKKLELSYDNFRKLRDYCNEKGIIFLSTPHSCKGDVDLVAELCSAIKVGSGDLTNIPILKHIAQKKTPVILSTGMAVIDEINEAVETIKKEGNNEIVLLHCTTNYPCSLENVNLKAINTLKKEFGLLVGYSDHTEGIIVSAMAVVLGACVIEKHFTLDKSLQGPDHKASLEPKELKELVKLIRETEKILGNGLKVPMESEKENTPIARKSIVAARDIKEGEMIKEDMLAIKRPGTGILPKHINEVVGRMAIKEIKKDSLLALSDLK
jgi:N,N'-diacetyllegionaminate synthase